MQKCKRCGTEHKDHSTMEQRVIIQRDNGATGPHITRARGVMKSKLWFCKGQGCGGYYQMGCEG